MKTITSKLILVTLVLFFTGTTFSYSKKDPRRTNSSNSSIGITYVVEVDASSAGSPCYTYMVSVQDEDGNYLAGSIIYMEGINTYVFHESGPISGIRSAFLARIDSPCCNSCNNIWYTQPHHVQANFLLLLRASRLAINLH